MPSHYHKPLHVLWTGTASLLNAYGTKKGMQVDVEVSNQIYDSNPGVILSPVILWSSKVRVAIQTSTTPTYGCGS